MPAAGWFLNHCSVKHRNERLNNMKRIVLTLLVVAVHQSCGIIVSQGTAGPVKRFVPLGTAERVVSAHTFDTKNPEPWGNKQFKEITITKNVPVPYPIKVERHVAVPVKIPVPIAIHNKVPIVVERKIPVYVEKPIPVQVDRPVPYALPIEIPIFHRVAVEVPKPYPVHIPKPYPVYIKKPIFVKQSKTQQTKWMKKSPKPSPVATVTSA
ncbi:MAGE-like protein 2 [Anopheles gambiae]|uniref:MAGE-like protein 2 n=1 Tax=Anopheles gambiae TaxID=7165 RepID=UPI002AC9B574|nr:MAGE-like protein 2 [Anopheles gambiae]